MNAPLSGIADKVIQDQKYGLAEEKIVIDDRHQRGHEREPAEPPLPDDLIEGKEVKGEECCRVVKVLEYDVAGLKTGKRIEEASDEGPGAVPDLPADPRIGSDHGSAVPQGHDKGQDIRHGLLFKGDGQPEERAAPQVKGKASAHTAPQVYIRIPEELSVPDGSVGKDIEGDLLHVIVAVIEKDPAVIDQKGKDRCQIQQRSSRKDQYILQSGRTFFCQNMSL